VTSSFPLTERITAAGGPVDLAAYERAGGYTAARNALTKMTPKEVQDLVKAANLRGRGGAGFPTGQKWSFVPMGEAAGPGHKYLVCNADEMEPGTFKDRYLMEFDPHLLVEGSILAAFAIGADKAFIFLRGEYHACARALTQAINEATTRGYLGRNAFDSGIAIDLAVHMSGGRYICGEETALLNALESKRAQPRTKPPFPPVSGAWGRPSVVNNVETLCNVPGIVRNGAEWFQQLGRGTDAGTKLFGVSGRVKRPGLWELPMGTTIREILDVHAGGMRDGYKFKGLLPGGASTDFLVEQHLDLPMEYGTIQAAGSRMGTGTMTVIDHTVCIVDLSRNLQQFFAQESCGFCTPCREGLPWLENLLTDLEEGRGQPGDLDVIVHNAQLIGAPGNTFCLHATGAIEPLSSAIKYFRDEFDAHIRERGCPLRSTRAAAAS
jgi:NADH-quinone oxidoreductase subunit F